MKRLSVHPQLWKPDMSAPGKVIWEKPAVTQQPSGSSADTSGCSCSVLANNHSVWLNVWDPAGDGQSSLHGFSKEMWTNTQTRLRCETLLSALRSHHQNQLRYAGIIANEVTLTTGRHRHDVRPPPSSLLPCYFWPPPPFCHWQLLSAPCEWNVPVVVSSFSPAPDTLDTLSIINIKNQPQSRE